MVPFITCVTTFGPHVRELVVGVNIFDLDLGAQLILSNNQSSATLWVLDTCLIVGLLPLIIILITAPSSSPHVTIDQHLGFPFIWAWICDFAHNFLLRDLLVFRYCSMNVTLLSHRSIS